MAVVNFGQWEPTLPVPLPQGPHILLLDDLSNNLAVRLLAWSLLGNVCT